ncbi:hypothetical protein CYLTODRAFT_378657 [Cylindrobasidium torrendii FP15055 ss-10]|uniref:Uncharacterized protein n=1 Tax=Cylindrobasidium torrendii FP15055 ss-10 TaxID=1314674 RepID=A0A0D7B5W1_9AGAR|nr:hypothetical protein CYLTODRAFT_378657 [Cylindrobasidium torrendii FP15055 ss-10]
MAASSEAVSYTPEGAVLISYTTLVSRPETLNAAIEKGFGSAPDCLGLIVVKDLPEEYGRFRERLLRLAYCNPLA